MPTAPYFLSVIQMGAADVGQAGSMTNARRENLERASAMVERVAKWIKPAVVVLPKGFLQGRAPDDCTPATLQELAVRWDGPELGELGRLAAACGLYLAGGVYVKDHPDGPVWSGGFVIDPKGALVLRYRQLVAEAFDTLAPVATPRGEPVASLLPVVDTPYGRLGCLVGPDINTFEIAKSLVFRGAEVLVHPALPPPDWLASGWVQARRARGYQARVVVASASLCALPDDGFPPVPRGYSCVVDWQGRVLAQAESNGVAVATARIDLGALRRQRRQVEMNFPAQTRAALYAGAWTHFQTANPPSA